MDMIQYIFYLTIWIELSGLLRERKVCVWLAYEGVSEPDLQKVWKLKIPIKIRFFLWQVIHDGLATREKILTRHGPTDGKFQLCGECETLDHPYVPINGCICEINDPTMASKPPCCVRNFGLNQAFYSIGL